MRRKLTAILLCAAVMFTSGCAMAAQQVMAQEDTYDLYFQVRELDDASGGDAIGTESSPIEKRSGRLTEELAESMVTLLLDGPEDESLKSPFPTGTSLQSVTVEGSRAVVDLTMAYSTLSGVALTIADYCMTLTLTQLPEIQTVSITVGGQELAYRSTQSFSARDVLFSSTEDVVSTADVTLYFLNERGGLTGEERTLYLYEGDTLGETLVRTLMDGPEEKGLSSALPEGFTVQTVLVEEDVCYVNLSSSMLEELQEGTVLRPAIRALARSLLSLESVEAVRFLVNGEAVDSIGGVDVSQVIEN